MTAERRREPRAEEREQQFVSLVVDRLADGVLVVDDDGTVLFANAAAADLLGRRPADLVGTEFGYPLVVGEAAEVELVRPGAALISAELRAVETSWAGRHAWLLSLHDITDRKRAEERLLSLADERTARAEAESASQTKSDFLAVMSHELRTPLNAILGYADLMAMGVSGALTDMQQSQVARISASGRHLLTLVDELLDVSKAEAGRLTVDRSPHDAAQVAEAALMLIQPQAEATGLSVTSGVAAPSAGGDGVSYLGDESRVRQVLVNLLSNAVKFTPPGGTIRLTVDVRQGAEGFPEGRSGEWVVFSVADEGIGIAAENLEAVFAPFRQIEQGHTRRHEGTGLGLSISRQLARVMGGEIMVESVVNRGSVFSLWLPAASAGGNGGARAITGADNPASSPTDEDFSRYSEVGEMLLSELSGITASFVAKLREDPMFERFRALSTAQIADHIATLLADIAATLGALKDTEGLPTPIVSDSADIQRMLSERHAHQRLGLGWRPAEFRRESALLRDEVEAALRRVAPDQESARLDRILQMVSRLLQRAERDALRILERTA